MDKKELIEFAREEIKRISTWVQDKDRQMSNENRDCVEVIRCKDCKWFGEIGCAVMVVDDSDKPTENDYCSFAEPKEQTDEKSTKKTM